jgi:hypothetical protein
MQEIVEPPISQNGLALVARRNFPPVYDAGGQPPQFVDLLRAARPEVTELAEAVDQYKLRHRRRLISFEELYEVITELGYRK